MKNKSPAFQFYVNDWLGSTKIAMMSPAEEGGYIRLLAHAWNSPDCSLPDDDEVLAILSRLNEGWFNGSSTKIKACFKIRRGKLYNSRLLFERKKQKEWSEKSRVGGVNSAKARKDRSKGNEGGSRVVQPKGQPKGNTSSSSSSSSSNKVFKKPTALEVTEYAKSIGFYLKGQKFLDHYDSNGWKVGKNSMKDWKAAVRTWKSRDKDQKSEGKNRWHSQ